MTEITGVGDMLEQLNAVAEVTRQEAVIDAHLGELAKRKGEGAETSYEAVSDALVRKPSVESRVDQERVKTVAWRAMVTIDDVLECLHVRAQDTLPSAEKDRTAAIWSVWVGEVLREANGYPIHARVMTDFYTYCVDKGLLGREGRLIRAALIDGKVPDAWEPRHAAAWDEWRDSVAMAEDNPPVDSQPVETTTDNTEDPTPQAAAEVAAAADVAAPPVVPEGYCAECSEKAGNIVLHPGQPCVPIPMPRDGRMIEEQLTFVEKEPSVMDQIARVFGGTGLTRPQLEKRTRLITASEIGAIAGHNRWKTPLDVYLEKVEGVKKEAGPEIGRASCRERV